MNLHSTGQGVLSLPSLGGQYNEEGGTPSSGDEPRTFTKGLKRIGTDQGVATSQLGGTHKHASLAKSLHQKT